MRYYLDTSIWLDLFEDRNETGFSKSVTVQKMMTYIVSDENRIVISPIIIDELVHNGHSKEDIARFFHPFKKLLYVQHCYREILVQASSIAHQKGIPKNDVLHALLSRNSDAILITRDGHFSKLVDITVPVTPEELLQSKMSF